MRKFVIDSTHDIINLFRNITDNLRKKGIKAECVLDGDITVATQEETEMQLQNVLAETAGEFFCDTSEPDKIRRILTDYSLGKKEFIKIYTAVIQDSKSKKQRLELLKGLFLKNMQVSDKIYVDGLVNFRFADYNDALEEAVTGQIESYMAEKAHKEFLDLLKYFALLQQSGVMKVNVYGNTNDGYVLTDDTGCIIDEEMCDGFIDESEMTGLSHEDILLSRLICLSPCEIVIHGTADGKISETLKYIFENKIKFSGAEC